MAANQIKTVSGLLPSRAPARRAIDELVARSFVKEEISVVMTDIPREEIVDDDKTAEGAAVGAAVGGAGGAILAAAAAIGSVVIPGLGLIVAGPVLGALTGAVAGSASGAAAGAAIPPKELETHRSQLESGAIWVGAHTVPERVETAKEALRAAGAERMSVF
jgi:hypothetical protein